MVGHGFAPRLGHTKDHRKNGSNCRRTWHAGISVRIWQCNLTVKGQVVCGTVYGYIHYKNLLGSIVRERYCIPFLDFSLVLHWPLMLKKHSNWLIDQLINLNPWQKGSSDCWMLCPPDFPQCIREIYANFKY